VEDYHQRRSVAAEGNKDETTTTTTTLNDNNQTTSKPKVVESKQPPPPSSRSGFRSSILASTSAIGLLNENDNEEVVDIDDVDLDDETNLTLANSKQSAATVQQIQKQTRRRGGSGVMNKTTIINETTTGAPAVNTETLPLRNKNIKENNKKNTFILDQFERDAVVENNNFIVENE
jgi:hypothetical protein